MSTDHHQTHISAAEKDRMRLKIAAKFTQAHIAARERLLDEAVSAGKFPMSRRQHYGAMFDASPGTAQQVIAMLTPCPLPTTDRSAEVLATHPPYNPRWLSRTEDARLQLGRRGAQRRVQQEA